MSREDLTFWITALSAACWIICFWWMHRISARQDALLIEMQQQANRIEALSQAEHDLIQDVHPKVGAIKETIERVATKVSKA
jgi:hypothetical protein